jgi:hypothetical protein
LRTAIGTSHSHWHSVAIITRPDAECEAGLFQIVGASNALGFGFGFGQGREEHSRQDRDNRDHDEQLDERKSSELFACLFHTFVRFWFFVWVNSGRTLLQPHSQSNPFSNFL